MTSQDVETLEKAAIGEIWNSGAAYERLVQLCDAFGPRFAGTEGETQAASLLATWLSRLGLAQVRCEPFNYIGWQRGASRLAVVEPCARELRGLALPYSPKGQFEASLWSVGAGESEDYRLAGAGEGSLTGKVVLCAAEPGNPSGNTPSHRRLKYRRAVEAGAVAFLYFNQNPGGLAVTGSLATGEAAPIPGLGLAFEDGATLLRLLARGPVRVRIDVTATFPEVESVNVAADLPANIKSPHSKDVVLVGAHYDSHDISPGALDNGSGVAIVLAAAQGIATAYRNATRGPSKRLRFCLFGAEEIGLLGSWAYVKQHSAELAHIRFMLNVDDVGEGEPGTESLILVGCPDLAPHVTEQVREIQHTLSVQERLSTSSDHFPFVMQGIPAGLIVSEKSPGTEGKLLGRGWGHTIADTVDKVRPATIQSAASVMARLLLRLVEDDSWPARKLAPSAVEANLAATGHLAELRRSGRWPPPW